MPGRRAKARRPGEPRGLRPTLNEGASGPKAGVPAPITPATARTVYLKSLSPLLGTGSLETYYRTV